ncbi:MAG: cytotoxic translational repressor of toxin-antitoxin stability system [Humidesulfovibrio sp.]|nr:cytotoxic translational repressor of toxin-antitoxin stability system [Humidesulfovibrio sp.]
MVKAKKPAKAAASMEAAARPRATWTVKYTESAQAGAENLPEKFRAILTALVLEIEKMGPVRGNWPNYSKLGQDRHHCHLKKKSKPTYVAVWEVRGNTVRLVEVTYAGTRENAPY